MPPVEPSLSRPLRGLPFSPVAILCDFGRNGHSFRSSPFLSLKRRVPPAAEDLDCPKHYLGCLDFSTSSDLPESATANDHAKMGLTYSYVAGFASLLLFCLFYPQLALWAGRMSPASLAGSLQKSCGQSTS